MHYQSEAVTMWFDRRIVYRKSPIHGTGTFALSAIHAGESLIVVKGGLVYTAEERRNGGILLEGSMYNEESLSDNLFILTPLGFHYYINHSCAANIVDLSRHPSTTHYVALRDIQADEELTADYYTLDSLDACACGTPQCRWKK